MKSDLIDIECKIVSERETSIAITDGTMETYKGREQEKWFWLPRSQIEIMPNGKTWTVTMPEWLATERGLIL
jgi:hypothetical protein